MAKKKKAPKAPHCKSVTRADGSKRKMCRINGKLTTAAKVKAAKARA